MKKIVIVRGQPGSGKSHLLNEVGLGGYSLSLDTMRQAFSSLTMAPSGELIMSHENSKYVMDVVMKSFDVRTNTGETMAYDATSPKPVDAMRMAEYAARSGYEAMYVDFFGVPLEVSRERLLSRPIHLKVPDRALERIHGMAERLPDGENVVYVRDGESYVEAVKAVRAFLAAEIQVRDLSSYDRIVHVGDLQGTVGPLMDPRAPTANGIDVPGTFFVFHGDLLDRGEENAEVIRWWQRNVMGRSNYVHIAGNHEDHIEIQGAGGTSGSREFANRTLPALRADGITDAELKAIGDGTVPVLQYFWRGKAVLCSHAGYTRWPQRIDLLSQSQIRKGNAHHQTPIHEMWNAWAAEAEERGITIDDVDACWTDAHLPVTELWQAFGHRNTAMSPIVSGRCLVLEGQVEFGGHMRFAVLSQDGWEPIAIRPRRFRPSHRDHQINIDEGRQMFEKKIPIAPWISRGEDRETPVPADVMEAFAAHPLVYSRRSEVLRHVSAINFTKQAFFDQQWDTVNMKARGFFVSDDNVVVARSYEKFQAHKELAETEEECDAIVQREIRYDAVAYSKPNGFLGISGYDSVTDSLVLASKSRLDGDFAGYFRTIAQDLLGDVGMEKLFRLNRDQVASCVFEVVDPVNDPHIIKEDRPRLILLDVIRRHHEFERMPYEDLVRIGAWLGCEVKQIVFKAPNWIALKKQIRQITTSYDWTPGRGHPHSEGVVVESARGEGEQFMFKLKGAYYRAWKWMRTAKDLIVTFRAKGGSLDMSRYEHDARAMGFLTWALRQPTDVLSRDIVFLRDAYEADPDGILILDQAPPAPMEPAVPDQTMFLKGVDALAKQIEAGTAKAASVRRIIDKASEDEHRLAAFDAHPAAGILRGFALADA
jgi:predicted kinase